MNKTQQVAHLLKATRHIHNDAGYLILQNGTKNYRKQFTGSEVEKLLTAVKGSRNEACDSCLLLLIFRHGLRVKVLL
ncbi:MAG: hypothetical protein PHY92_09325 [Alphaproteobacteria bacterium]|nr:hypothetical protein [Alphaproteobacteria bacterium]